MMPTDDDNVHVKVRQKYGLGSSMGSSDGSVVHSLSHSKSYEEIFMSVDDHLTNFAEGDGGKKRAYGKEVATILAILQRLARKIIDELVVAGLTMETEHPLLDPLCRIIEIALYHGLRHRWGRRNGLWGLLEKIPYYTSSSASVSAIENVKQFASLKSGSSKIRAWIMLALMNKCLGADLELLSEVEGRLIEEVWEPWALMRSEQFATLVCFLGSLDSIDFNLYVKEQTIEKDPFKLEWDRLFGVDGVHFGAIEPPIDMPSFILQ